MDNSLLIYSDTKLEIERFHLCIWEFDSNSSLVELGFEIPIEPEMNNITFFVAIPWLNEKCTATDYYDKLKTPENSKFIFNDSINSTVSLDGGNNRLGVKHEFHVRDSLCILPLDIQIQSGKIKITVNLDAYHRRKLNENIYCRLAIKPNIPYISIRKNGISKSTIIYDIKVNEKRNISDGLLQQISTKDLCIIKQCFVFNIIPNKYDIVFFDGSSLKNVRTLEYDSFNRYLGDKRVKKDELLVIFNKKKDSASFSFFSIYAKERIGPGQYALAILVNILCGILIFIPSFRLSFYPNLSFLQMIKHLPAEIYLALIIVLTTAAYFIWPKLENRR